MKGSGGCHINLADDDDLGGPVNIWTSNGNTRLLRALIPWYLYRMVSHFERKSE